MVFEWIARRAGPLGLCLAVASLTLPPAMAQVQPAGFAEALRPRLQAGGQPVSWTLAERMDHYGVPGLAIAIIEDGEIVYLQGHGVLQVGSPDPVTPNTLFSAGSVSKIATSALALHLAADGRLDLDADVLSGLSTWSLPDSRDPFGSQVSLRAILSHTAGFNLHGFEDYQPGAALPSVTETLDGTGPAQNDALERRFEPGSRYAYSGGGFTLAQLYLSDRSGLGFEALAEAELFTPLGMDRSTFANPLPETVGNIARAHDRSGQPTALPRGYEAMPEMAASGLWTSAADLGRLVAQLIGGYRGEPGYLSPDMARAMMTRIAPGEHGLGPRLTGTGDSFIFHHGGANDSYQTWIEGHLVTGDGLVILTNGAQGRALINEVRNGVADTMGWNLNRPVILPERQPTASDLAGFVGTYSVDPSFPIDLRQQMVGWIFESALEFRLDDDSRLMAGRAGGDRFEPLIALTPTRFVMPGFSQTVGIAELEFHRNALGEVTGMSFHLENATSHYRRG
ncbi:serine hydrolase domain-containing protein [Maricaulis sp.]|uniref:serine hydrolase domain-containing protein n=1 Tax=Maricaulis sp. TaxID=1486257 RepID=UPI002B26F4BF|nr:serine hydrolase domain-containing protein [Maricaulis sp.]